MKKVLMLLFIVCVICGCQSKNQDTNETMPKQAEAVNVTEYEILDQKIKIVINGQDVVISLYDNALSKQLIEALPLDCEFIEYGNCEKAADVKNLIVVEDEPLGYEPKPGDVVVYEPWGNFTVFFDEFRYSEALAPIGTVESGLDVLAQIDGNFSAHVEIID